jgi:hypothetical protein
MINQQLLDFIKQQLSLGLPKEKITQDLLNNGWNASDVEEGFNTIAPKPIATPVYVPPAYTSPAMPVTPTIQPQNIEQTVFIKPTHKIKKIAYFVLILILIGGLGGAAYAYYAGAFVSLPSLVSQSIDSVRKATSATYDTTISIDFSGVKSITSSLGQLFGGVSTSTATITAQGSYDSSNTNNKKASSVISINVGVFSLGAEIRVLNNTLYGVLTKTPTIAFIPTLSSLQNKWFSVPYTATDGTTVNNPLSSISMMNSSIIDKLTADQQEHIYEMTRDAHFLPRQSAEFYLMILLLI